MFYIGAYHDGRFQTEPDQNCRSSKLQSHGDNEKVICCANSLTETNALINFYNRLGGNANWNNKWNIDSCPCLDNWYGIKCNKKGYTSST